jgi:hypothetical protein
VGWVTLGIAVLTCGTIAFAISRGPRTVTYEEVYARESLEDPKPGAKFDLAGLGGRPVILAMLGDCTGCSMHKIDFNDLRQTGGYQVIGVHTPDAKLDEVSAEYPWFKLAPEPRDLHGELNVYWTPRAYAFDGDGSLIAVQKPSEGLAKFVERLGATR